MQPWNPNSSPAGASVVDVGSIVGVVVRTVDDVVGGSAAIGGTSPSVRAHSSQQFVCCVKGSRTHRSPDPQPSATHLATRQDRGCVQMELVYPTSREHVDISPLGAHGPQSAPGPVQPRNPPSPAVATS